MRLCVYTFMMMLLGLSYIFPPGQPADDKKRDSEQAGDEAEVEAEDSGFGQGGEMLEGIE